jgi:hypothetical protein
MQPDLHPLDQTGPGKTFKLDAPTGSAVMCARAKLLPTPYDIQVVLAGFPFMIAQDPGNRVGVLEIDQGTAKFRMVQGAMTEDEQKALKPLLDEMQTIVNASIK